MDHGARAQVRGEMTKQEVEEAVDAKRKAKPVRKEVRARPAAHFAAAPCADPNPDAGKMTTVRCWLCFKGGQHIVGFKGCKEGASGFPVPVTMRDAKTGNHAPKGQSTWLRAQEMAFATPLGRAVFAAVFRPPRVNASELFLPRRTAFVYELDAEPGTSDIPTTLRRSKADCPPVRAL